MSKYSLTPRQQEILRAVAEGLKDETIDSTWHYIPAIGDEYAVLMGFSRSVELKMRESDLNLFARMGFISEGERRQHGAAVYHVYEQNIIDAVESGFEMPSTAHPSQVSVSIGSISGANAINIGTQFDRITQTINADSSLDEGDKSEIASRLDQLRSALEELQATNPRDAQTLAKNLNRVVEDLADDEPDNSGLGVSLEGLRRAADNLISVSPLVYRLATDFIQFVSSIRL